MNNQLPSSEGGSHNYKINLERSGAMFGSCVLPPEASSSGENNHFKHLDKAKEVRLEAKENADQAWKTLNQANADLQQAQQVYNEIKTNRGLHDFLPSQEWGAQQTCNLKKTARLNAYNSLLASLEELKDARLEHIKILTKDLNPDDQIEVLEAVESEYRNYQVAA